MEILKHIDVDNLHHAYLIEDGDMIFQDVSKHLTKRINSAEIYIREFDGFGIDDSRQLLTLAGMRSVGTQLFIYRIRSFTTEAQNALLKLFEEPPEHTHFFFFVNGVRNILPTLQSRVRIIEEGNIKSTNDFGKDFLGMTLGERLECVSTIAKDKDRAKANRILQEVETILYEQKELEKNREILRHIIEVRSVLQDKGASMKILLESVAVTIPTTSK